MINLIDVEKYYKTPQGDILALKNINLDISAGEIFGVIGKSGAGKSTLIRCINLLEKPSSGSIIVAGQSLTTLNNRQLRHARRQIGMIFQHFNLLSTKTVYDNIALPLKLQGFGNQLCEKVIQPLLELTGLTNKKKNYPNELSGGQKQRVAIARSLASQPKVLLCDEATSALDPDTTKSILALLKDININLGLTILLITHEMDVIKSICDRVALMEHGEIIKQCSVIDFFSKPHPEPGMEFLKSYLRHELPDLLQENLLPEATLLTYPVLRIYFYGEATSKPIIANLIQTYQLQVNILQANIEQIKNTTIGLMVITINDNNNKLSLEKLSEVLVFLRQQNITVEVIGHVARDAISAS